MADPSIPTITAPQPPQAPVPPAPPAVNILGTDDPRALVRKMVTTMRDGGTVDLSLIPPAAMGKLEEALIPELNDRELADYGYRLRSMLRFYLAQQTGLLTPRTPWAYTMAAEGTKQKAILLGPHGSVELALDASMVGSDKLGAFVLAFKGSTRGVHWLQFIWRRIVASYPAGKTGKAKDVPLQHRYTFKGKAVVYTEDTANTRWSVDGSDPERPFYEGSTTVLRTADSLKLVDSPSPNHDDAQELFSASPPPPKCVSTFAAATYLIKDMEVLYRADLKKTWTITASGPGGILVPVGDEWNGSGKAVSALAPEHRAALARQFPRWDYLPGGRIAAPVKRPPFRPLSQSHPDFASWPTGKPRLDRFRAAATVAKAKLIEDVDDDPALTIHEGVKREGLSLFPNLGDSGQAGFVDEAGTYHNPRLPHERFGALPKVAMLLGKEAFEWGNAKTERDKIYTLAVMRHEMMHAVHDRIAIEWLLKWRDELTKDDFPTWLANQKITPLDRDLVLTGVPRRGNAPTETLAWGEGFVTALPFLPANPSLAAFDDPDKPTWPAAIIQLDGMLAHRKTAENYRDDKGVAYVHTALDQRLREVICGVLDKQQRAVLIQWVDFLTAVNPDQVTDPDQKPSAKTFKSAFESHKSVLLGIRKIAEKCK